MRCVGPAYIQKTVYDSFINFADEFLNEHEVMPTPRAMASSGLI
jgi:hypothetical protein